ncbi:hypothetical protein [Paenibacillus oleatilyticus]|uniref:hypothetical protein n=1 Tax=Paenibacillus oleatilyticus TaxID=2594886 RepID=UPI001C1F31B2|nr:hypothetical protein [Paenibacillus oleatilyticus]MBU7318504.1 hypothetical protein [Paenibacillus oleatilyticus]
MKKKGLVVTVPALLCAQPAALAEGTIQVKVNQLLLGTEATGSNDRRHGYGCCPAFGGSAWSTFLFLTKSYL